MHGRIYVYARRRVLSVIVNVGKYISVRLLLINMCAHYGYNSVQQAFVVELAFGLIM